VVLLHGKNFCAATWAHGIASLNRAGFRVIAPDPIGFCKSSKPAAYQFSLGQLAADTQALLASLGVQRYVLIGHSMGGMLAIRLALNAPDSLERLVLVNPIGREDWRAAGVPALSIDALYAKELKATAEGFRQSQLKT